jgi:hypothetical protein
LDLRFFRVKRASKSVIRLGLDAWLAELVVPSFDFHELVPWGSVASPDGDYIHR